MNNPWRGRGRTLEQRSVPVNIGEFGSSSIVFGRDLIKEKNGVINNVCAGKRTSIPQIHFNIPLVRGAWSGIEKCNNFSLFPHNLTKWKCFCLICSAASSCHNIDITAAAAEVAVQILVTPGWRSGLCLVGFWSVQLKILLIIIRPFQRGVVPLAWIQQSGPLETDQKRDMWNSSYGLLPYKSGSTRANGSFEWEITTRTGCAASTSMTLGSSLNDDAFPEKSIPLEFGIQALTKCWIHNKDRFLSVTLLFTYCDTPTFADRTAARRWERVGRPNWPFLMNSEEARAHPEVIRPLSSELIWIKINQEWTGFCSLPVPAG